MKGLLLKIDKSNMRQVILDFPKQFRIGLEGAQRSLRGAKRPPRIENVVICGMGGSALAGGLLQDFVNLAKIDTVPFIIHRSYGLPNDITQNSLVICSSYSGNTEETIDSYRDAVKQRLNIVALTTGGRLAKLTKRNNRRIRLVVLPDLHIEPRDSIGMQFAALATILMKYRVLPDIKKDILRLETRIEPKRLEESGKRIAKTVLGRIPLIYSSPFHESLAYNWKIRFNETSKTHAFMHVFPELNHNEMSAYEKPRYTSPLSKLFFVIMLRDEKDHTRIQKRMRLTARLISGSAKGVEVVNLRGKTVLEKMFKNLVLADWAAYWLAFLRKVDPTPVRVIETFKEQMKKSR